MTKSTSRPKGGRNTRAKARAPAPRRRNQSRASGSQLRMKIRMLDIQNQLSKIWFDLYGYEISESAGEEVYLSPKRKSSSSEEE